MQTRFSFRCRGGAAPGAPLRTGVDRAAARALRDSFAAAAVFAAAVALAGRTTRAQALLPPEERGRAGLELALRRLGTTRSVLFVTAHPDDEDNGLLSLLRLGRGYRVSLLTLTRGAGGQNEIGTELGEALSVLRTAELAAVHRRDGVEQLFGRAVDFGYSFSVEETYRRWGESETTEDIARAIRSVRPDVLITLVPSGEGGGQHHQASARLADAAVEAAADPTRFPRLLEEGLRPWRPALRLRMPFALPPGKRGQAFEIPLGGYDEHLGMTYAEHGAVLRALHRSQGMKPLPDPRQRPAFLLPVGGHNVSRNGRDPFLNIPDGAGRIRRYFEAAPEGLRASAAAELARFEEALERARRAAGAGDLPEAAGALAACLQAVRATASLAASLSEPERSEVRFLLDRESEDARHALERALLLDVSARISGGASLTRDGLLPQGGTVEVTTMVRAYSALGIEVTAVRMEAPPGWRVETLGEGEANAETAAAKSSGKGGAFRFRMRHRLRIPVDAEPARRHWYLPDARAGRYAIRLPPAAASRPFPPPPLLAAVGLRAAGVEFEKRVPVTALLYDAASGRYRERTAAVVPAFSVSVAPRSGILRLWGGAPAARTLHVRVRSNLDRPVAPIVRLEPPEGWRSEPAEVSLRLDRPGSEIPVRFTLTPPSDLVPGTHSVAAVVHHEGRTYREAFRTIDYPHIEPREFFSPAIAKLHAFPLALPPGLRVGYVTGPGDLVAEAIAEMGAQVVFLDEEALFFAPLEEFDAVVVGVRAYLTRKDLIASNDRLLDYVRKGGVMIVQYQKYEFNEAQYGPYPARISRPHDRVTDETSPVRVLAPEHRVFNRPNAIGPRDWEGWVQERGLYFLGEWDQRYVPLLELRDPFPYNPEPKRGALLIARYGRGEYVYTGLAFFRQLPAGVPGAYRLFANLLSLRRTR